MADNSFAMSFAHETWSLYGVGMFLVVLRYIARLRRFGITGLKIDDYFMINGTIWYTMLCISLNQVASGGGSNLMTDDDIANLTPETYAERVAGSKWVFVSEHSMILTIWSCKLCMLILYRSITDGLKQRKWVNWLAIWIGLSWVGNELALFLSCRPIQQYWAVPAADAQCSTYQHYEIMFAIFNIPGDIAMLCIGIPILARIRLPTQQKAILLLIFGMGGFIIVASILTKVYCLVPSLISYVYMNWYFREASVAMYVTNLPGIWPLMRDMFPLLRTWGSTRKNTATHDKRFTIGGSRSHITSKDGHQLKSFTTISQEKHESQEHIRGESESSRSLDETVLEIHQNVTVTVESQDLEAGQRPQDPRWGWEKNKAESTTVVRAAN